MKNYLIIFKKGVVMIYILLLINPLMSILYYFLTKQKVYLNRSRDYFYISLCLAIIGMGMPLSGDDSDLSRHFYRYENIDLTQSILEHFKGEKDYVIKFIYYYGKSFGIKKEFMTMFFVFIGYFCYIKSFFLMTKNLKKNDIKYINKVFLCFCLSISFTELVYGLRMAAAIGVFLYGSCLYLKGNKKGIIYIFFANIIHFMVNMYSIIFLCVPFFKNKQNILKILFYISVVSTFIPVTLLQDLLKNLLLLLPSTFDKYKALIDIYIFGYWGVEYLEDRSFRGMLYIQLLKIKYIWLFFYLKKYCLQNSKESMKVFLILLSTATFFLYSLPQLGGRYVNFPFLLSIILFGIEKLKSKKFFYFLVGIAILLCFLELFRIRDAILGGIEKLFYPTIYNLIYDNIKY